MYDDKDYGFNWLGLFIKVIIFVIFILLAVWLVTKVFFGYSKKDLANDLSDMKRASETYFVDDNLPSEVGKSRILTLEEMLNRKIVKSKTIDSCDKEQSYAKVTKYEEYYLIKVELVCQGKEKSTTTKINNNGKKENNVDEKKLKEDSNKNSNNSANTNNNSTNNDVKTSNSNNNTNTNNNSTNNDVKTSNSNNSTSTNSSSYVTTSTTTKVTKKLYYEYAKIKYKTVNEKKATYCKLEYNNNTYYSLANDSYNNYMNKTKFSYTARVSDIPANATSLTINNVGKFSSVQDFEKYAAERNKNTIMWTKGNNDNIISDEDLIHYMSRSATKGYNVDVKIDDNRLVTITVTINNIDSRTESLSRDENIFMPVKFSIAYYSVDTDNCVEDLYNNKSKYSSYQITETWNAVKYVEDGVNSNDTIWNTAKSVNGYKRTGRTEYR